MPYKPVPSPLAARAVPVAIGLVVAVVVTTAAAYAGVGGHDHGRPVVAIAQVKADLRNAATAEETYLTDYDVYTSSTADLEAEGFRVSRDDAITAVADGSTGYCITGTAPELNGRMYYYNSETGGLTTVPCGGGL